jgi:hypothetical protein
MQWRTFLVVAVFSFLGSGCAGPRLEDFTGSEPAFALQDFFDGELSAHGIVRDRAGRVTRSFNATINASRDGDATVLDEAFLFSDGERQRRVWRIEPTAEPGRYSASAGDVIGPARLESRGSALRLRYVLRVPYRGSELDLSVDDWMYRVSENVVINVSTLRKWGVRVGSIELAIVREPTATLAPPGVRATASRSEMAHTEAVR